MRTFLTFVGLVAVLALAAGPERREPPSAADQFPSIMRLGPAAAELMADDLAQIEGLARATWIVVTHRAGMVPVDRKSARRSASVFVRSDQPAAPVRRGALLHVAGIASTPSGPTTWAVSGNGQWAQVPVAGRAVDAIDGPRDLNRPFLIAGSIPDASLHEAITVIRSSPRIAPPPTTRTKAPVHSIFTDVRGSWPVQRVVVRDASTLHVYLIDEDASEASGQEVTLSRKAGAWAVSRLRAFTTD